MIILSFFIVFDYRLGSVAPNGKLLPIINKRNVHPKLYNCLLVNPDGSTYTIRTTYPYKIITLPLDLSKLSEEEIAVREREGVRDIGVGIEGHRE